MKAITIWQPWASLIACGAKNFETRSWATSYKGPIAIHAAKKTFSTDRFFDKFLYPAAQALDLQDIYSFDTLPYGRIIAIAELVDCYRITNRLTFKENEKTISIREISEKELLFGDWTPGRYAWELTNVKMFPEPVPAEGKQRLWEWEALTL